MSPGLSILITYYNEGGLLTECLGSLLGQLRPGDEVLVYDDCSTDRPEPHIPAGAPVRVIRGDANVGPARGRNRLLREAAGEFVHFHDADDLFAPDWADRVRDALAVRNPDVVFTEVSRFGDGPAADRVLGLNQLGPGADLVRFCIRGGMLVPAGTYRKGVVEAVGGYRDDLWQSEDYDFHIRLAASGLRYEVIPDPLIHIRLRPGGRSRKQAEVYGSAVDAVERLGSELPTGYRDDLAAAAARFGGILYQTGEYRLARRAFRVSRRLGPAAPVGSGWAYRAAVRVLGFEGTELVRSCYRAVVPHKVRRRVRGAVRR